MNKIKLGIIGPGIIWERAHKPVLNRLKNLFAITAFCATSEASKNKVKKEFPDVPFFYNYKEMVKSPEVDAVVVLTPISLNPIVAMAALDSKKDVIVEKPIATDSVTAKKLINAEKKSGKKVFILEQNVFLKETDIFKRIVEDRVLGDLFFYEKLYHSFIDYKDSSSLNYGKVDWRIHPGFQLGTLFDSGIHEIAMLSRIFGIPKSVYSTSTSYRKEYGGFDHVAVLFQYEKYLKGFYSHSFLLNGDRNYFILRGIEGLAYASDNKIIIEKNNGENEILTFSDIDVHYDMWKILYDILNGNSISFYSTERSLEDILILEAISSSLKTSCKTDIKI